jgi:hypothetical protein
MYFYINAGVLNMIEIKTTTVKLPSDILIKIKAMAVEKGTTQNKIMNELIAKGLKTAEKDKPKIKQMPFTDPHRKGNFKNIMGKGKVENPENIDVLELKNSIHFKKELY